MTEAAKSNPFNDYVFVNATPSERGSFTLATEKALSKLEKFQLPDPSFFVLQWIQALVAAGAQKIDISYAFRSITGEFELSCKFDGPGYTPNEIDNLYDHVFRSGRQRELDRLRELSLGWLSACSLPLKKMTLSSNGRQRVRLVEANGTVEDAKASETGEEGTHSLTLEGRGNHHFEDILRRRCEEVPCELNFNTLRISSGPGSAGVPWPNRPFESGPTKGRMGATYSGNSTSSVAFIRYGVEFTTRPEAALHPPINLRVSDPTLTKNVSQIDVVRDEAYEDFLARVRSEMKSMGLQLTGRRIPSYQREALNRFIQSYVLSYIDVRVFQDESRLQSMGEEFKALVDFQMFRVAGGGLKSLAELHREYQEKGYLLYTLDQRGLMARWTGCLIVAEPEEMDLLKRFFSQMTPLTHTEVQQLCRGGLQHVLAAARKRPVAARCSHMGFTILVPDIFPDGKSTVVKKGKVKGKTIAGVDLSLILETSGDLEQSMSLLAQLKGTLHVPVNKLLNQLAEKLTQKGISSDRSRMRYAELCCEMLLYLSKREAQDSPGVEFIQTLPPSVLNAEILGLENGSLASIADLLQYVEVSDTVMMGGVFQEGLDSGVLDPMPKAQELVKRLLPPEKIQDCESLKREIANNPDLRFKIRRQTLMAGLSNNPSPRSALANFAREASAQAEEMAKIEREYKEALEGRKLFVSPDTERLSQLENEALEDDFESLSDEASPQVAKVREGVTPSPPPLSSEVAQRQKTLPALNTDLDSLRQTFPGFCLSPGAVHCERIETNFSFHLACVWEEEESRVFLLVDQQAKALNIPLGVQGFLRLPSSSQENPNELLYEAVEQLCLKALHAFRNEPRLASRRKRLRAWLLASCEHLPLFSQSCPRIAEELQHAAIVPCRGGRRLSWEQLQRQALRLGLTPVDDTDARDFPPDPSVDVISLQAPWRDSLLGALGFPRTTPWKSSQESLDFDCLLKNAWRDLTGVVSVTEAGLIDPALIAELSAQSTFWKKWRSGFLSWDKNSQRALLNPNHKFALKLTDKYRSEPIWAAILACALFSTINRGLEEVEDRHEREFLLGLLDNFD